MTSHELKLTACGLNLTFHELNLTYHTLNITLHVLNLTLHGVWILFLSLYFMVQPFLCFSENDCHQRYLTACSS